MNDRLLRVAILSLSMALTGLAGCGDDKGGGSTLELYSAALTTRGVPGPGITEYVFPLNGAQMVPPTGSNASGTVVMSLGKSSFEYSINLTAVFAVVRAELYQGGPGLAGQRVATLYSGAPAGVFNGTLVDSVIVSADLQSSTMGAVLDAIADGQAYVQILTTNFPLGEIRGQTAPSGIADFTLGSGSVLYEIDLYGLEGVTAVTLNEGPQGRAGILRVTLFKDLEGTGLTSGRLVSDIFRGTDVVDTTIDALLEDMRNGNTHVNVVTLDEPDGAIRGQVELVPE